MPESQEISQHRSGQRAENPGDRLESLRGGEDVFTPDEQERETLTRVVTFWMNTEGKDKMTPAGEKLLEILRYGTSLG